MNRFAAIDLGTNTFHMIIVEKTQNNEIKLLFRQRVFVKLADEGFKTINDKAAERGLNAIKDFKTNLNKFNVKTYKAYATSIFRRADNGIDFAKRIEKEIGIKVEIIDGAKESQLIFAGTKAAQALTPDYNLIMDIGGGSVEFIITNGQNIIFNKSFPIGILELYHRFEHKHPFNNQSLKSIENFLIAQTTELIKQLKKYKIKSMVGTAGSFDVLKNLKNYYKNDDLFELQPKKFNEFYKTIAFTSYEQRLEIQEIPKERKRLIIYAFAIINFSLKISQAETLRVTSFGMKEGMIWEMTNSTA